MKAEDILLELLDEIKRGKQQRKLLIQLYHHHMSQAKPQSVKCSSAYHKSITDKLEKVIFGKDKINEND